MLLLLLIAAGAAAQDQPSVDAAPLLAEAKERLAGLGDTDTDEAKRWREAIQDRIALIEEYLRTGEEREKLGEPESLADRRAAVESALAAQRQATVPKEVSLASPDEVARYEKPYEEAKAARDASEAERERVRNVRRENEAEQKKLSAREAEAKRRSDTLTKDNELTKYLRKNARIEVAVVAKRRAYLAEALKRSAALLPVLDLERDLAKLRFEQNKKVFDLVRADAARLRAAEAERVKQQAEEEKKAAERERDPVERFRRTTAADAKTVRAEIGTLKNKTQELIRAVEDRKTAIDRTRKDQGRLEQRLRVGGGSAAEFLRRVLERARRSRTILHETTLPRLATASARHQVDLVETLDRIWDLQQPDAENQPLKALVASVPEERREEARKAFSRAVEGTDGLIPALREKAAALETIDARYGDLAVQTATYEEELDRLIEYVLSKIYWIRSDPPLRFDPRETAREASRLWATLTSREIRSAVGVTRAGLLLLGVAAFLALFLLSSRRLRRRAEKASEGRRAVVARVLLGLLVALLPAGLLALLAAVTAKMDLPLGFDDPVPDILALVSLFVLVNRLAVWFLAPGGVSDRVLGQPVAVAKQVLRSVRIMTTAGVFFRAPAELLARAPLALEHIPRFLDTLWLAALAFALLLLRGRNSPLIRSLTAPEGFMRRLLGILSPLLALLLAGIVVMDVMGYRVGARYLMSNVGYSVLVALVLAALYASLIRWIGRVAAAVRARTMREDGVRAAFESSAAVTTEMTRLVALGLTVVAFVVLISFWGFNEVVMQVLDGVHLLEVGPDRWLTLWDICLAILWIVGGHLIVHNLSALYEYVVFPLVGGTTDKGGRFVLLALSRYVILVISYGAALHALKVGFANLGWILAAASVGLGFGLQEIIANFVSGLILLFERPIRVGDIITVGQTGGTVEKISIRATTVTTWERQTVIIPNKAFITQNLTNWTHQDRILRRTLKLGVAYGSDVGKVLRVLDDLVKEHRHVLKQPPHRIWFDGFGDSSLDFTIWFFARIEDGLSAMTELYTRIYERLNEEGIQIPFPQRDIHIKSTPAAEDPAGLPGPAEGPANLPGPAKDPASVPGPAEGPAGVPGPPEDPQSS